MIEIVAPEGLFAREKEALALRGVYAALAASIDATDNSEVSQLIGVTLNVIPKHRFTMGGAAVRGARVDVALPSVALSTFRRRREFIRDATAAIVSASSDASDRPQVVVRIVHLVDGGWGTNGVAVTNDTIDEGPTASTPLAGSDIPGEF